MHPVSFTAVAADGAARGGVATTARGTYRTPCFMPVGTRGAIKYLSAADYEQLGAEIVLGNTYHLMLRPGAETVAALGGLGRFAGWRGLTLTDSGGFQVFSLEPKVDDDGVTFRSVYDGSTHRFTPESAVAHAGAARRRHPDGARRVPAAAVADRGRAHSGRAHVGMGTTGPRRAPAQRPGAVRDRPGRRRRGDARRARQAHRRPRLRRVRHRWAVRRRDPRADAAGARRGDRAPAARPAQVPDGRRRPGVAGRGDRPRRRPVRLRDADPPRPPRYGADLDRASSS